MSKKSRERRERRKNIVPDDYMSRGSLEMARFGKNIIMKNNRTPEEHTAHMEFLRTEYPKKYAEISHLIETLKAKVVQCNPYQLLLYIRQLTNASRLNIFSEIDFTDDSNELISAQEYIQSIIVSTDHSAAKLGEEDEYLLYDEILSDYHQLYEKFKFFLLYWSAHIQSEKGLEGQQLSDIVESQYLYGVRGNRYQIFELEPIKSLLPPHDQVLLELFGVSADDIISGLEKLRHSLSQAYADAMMDFGSLFDQMQEEIDSGTSEEDALSKSRVTGEKLAQKLFGSGLINVKEVTGWDSRFIDLLSLTPGEYSGFWGDSDFAGWPIVELPVVRKPFIKIEGVSYAFLYYALFDNIYRNIQKGIMRLKPTYANEWKDKQTYASETMVADLFCKMLPGAAVYLGNYYPVRTSPKQMNENDIIMVYNNYLFVIEVKAGSFPSTPPISDFEAHIKAYQKLAEEGDSQCHRTLEYMSLHEEAKFYTRDKQFKFALPVLSSFEDVFTFSVTVDNFNEFAARAEKLSVISLKEKTIIISIDDLLVYASYFDSPIVFLHYLQQRKSSMDVPQFHMNDEFDHLGLYIDRNMYALHPEQYDEVKNVFWRGFRQVIDEYFCKLYSIPERAEKPVQKIPQKITEIINHCEANISAENICLAHYFLNLCTDAKSDMENQINYILKRQTQRHYMIPAIALGEIKYCIFISTPGIKLFTDQEKFDYAYAMCSRNEAQPVMSISLDYDDKGKLIFANGKVCKFSDLEEPEMVRIRKFGDIKARDWVEAHRRTHGEIGRNEYCPCGSGKKYKYCCLGNE